MDKIEELRGIILGINYDGVINNLEVKELNDWLDKNRSLSLNDEYKTLIRDIEDVLEDGMISDDERSLLLNYADKYKHSIDNISASLNELNGIIEGIVCDSVINDDEVKNLNNWLNNNKQLRGITVYDNITLIVTKVLEDNIVTSDEQEELLQLISSSIIDSKTNLRIEFLKKQIRARNIIGIDLIELIDNEDMIHKIHYTAEIQLKRKLESYSGISGADDEIIFLSLVLIALMEYDGSFYDKLETIYSDLYEHYNEQRINGTIRSLIRKYEISMYHEEKKRIINTVLLQSIVPQKFLSYFYEFIFDIYQKNFDYTLANCDLMDEFDFIYNGLRKKLNLEDDTLTLNVTKKTYRLIKTTKLLIQKEKNFESIKRLSVLVIKLIDKFFWDKDGSSIKNPYFRNGFNDWLKVYHREDHGDRKRTNEGNRWEPKLILNNDIVELIPPIHKIKDTICYSDIRVVVKNYDEILYENTRPEIEAIFGGYTVSVNKIQIKNPLGQLTYLLYEKDEVIYSTKKKLYRDVLFFNSNGNEVKANTNFDGELQVIHKNISKLVKDYLNKEKYRIGFANVDRSELLEVDGYMYRFSAIRNLGVCGLKLIDHYVVEANTKYEMYKRVDCLVFQSDLPLQCLGVKFNYKEFKLTDLNVKQNRENNRYEYIVPLKQLTDGIHTISVYDLTSSKNISGLTYKIALDSEYEEKLSKVDDYNYILDIKSSLTENISKFFDVQSIEDLGLFFKYNHMYYNFEFPLDIGLYKLDDSNWKPFSESIWKGDINPDTVLHLYGIHTNQIRIIGNSCALLDEIDIKNEHSVALRIGFIKKYESNYNTVHIGWHEDGEMKGICCVNHNYVMENECEFNFDRKNSQLIFSIAYCGRNSVGIEVYEGDQQVLVLDRIENSKNVLLKNINSNTSYTFKVYEKTRVGFKTTNNLIWETKKEFYGMDYFLNRSFRITKAYYFDWNIDDKNYQSIRLQNDYVKLNKQVDNDTYIGTIYCNQNGVLRVIKGFENVTVTINDIAVRTFRASITIDGDGLLLDEENKCILHNLNDRYATDIVEYQIYYKRGDSNETNSGRKSRFYR